MILEFKTAGNNMYGFKKYVGIDTDKKIFTKNNPRMTTVGIEIKTRDYNSLVEHLKQSGYVEEEYI